MNCHIPEGRHKRVMLEGINRKNFDKRQMFLKKLVSNVAEKQSGSGEQKQLSRNISNEERYADKSVNLSRKQRMFKGTQR